VVTENGLAALIPSFALVMCWAAIGLSVSSSVVSQAMAEPADSMARIPMEMAERFMRHSSIREQLRGHRQPGRHGAGPPGSAAQERAEHRQNVTLS
jgi:hypothetical protein